MRLDKTSPVRIGAFLRDQAYRETYRGYPSRFKKGESCNRAALFFSWSSVPATTTAGTGRQSAAPDPDLGQGQSAGRPRRPDFRAACERFHATLTPHDIAHSHHQTASSGLNWLFSGGAVCGSAISEVSESFGHCAIEWHKRPASDDALRN
jgi:hypothetical protein